MNNVIIHHLASFLANEGKQHIFHASAQIIRMREDIGTVNRCSENLHLLNGLVGGRRHSASGEGEDQTFILASRVAPRYENI